MVTINGAQHRHADIQEISGRKLYNSATEQVPSKTDTQVGRMSRIELRITTKERRILTKGSREWMVFTVIPAMALLPIDF